MFGRKKEEPPPRNAYRMRQEMFAIGDDFWIENGAGTRAFKVDGKALRIRKTLDLETAGGQPVYKIREALVHLRDTMDIETEAGKVATVKKALISPLREHYSVEFADGRKWEVQGKIADHQYKIETHDGAPIAEVGKKWFRVRDSYGVSIVPNQDDAFVLAVAIVVDQISHPHK
jgi:uncharacterized protein YxjI